MLCWCKDCDGVFKLSEEYLKNNGECPKVGCWGELVEVDARPSIAVAVM